MIRRLVLAAFGAICALALHAQTAPPWATGTYVYDGAGNIKAIGTDQYRYDAHGRMRTSTSGAGQSQNATYDVYGNLRTLATNGTTLTFGVDESTNRVTVQTDPVTGQPYNVFGTYDSAGRLLTAAGVGNTFAWDGLDVVTRSTADGTTRVHLYSPGDERIASIAVGSGTWEWTLRDPSGKVLRRFERTGSQWTWKEDYVYRGNSLLAAEVDTAPRTLHFFPDHLGTPRLITGAGGMKVSFHTYHPFGAEATSPAQDAEKLKFTGHERDAETLDYMHARYYAPKWGRFLSADPYLDLQKAAAHPQNWNRYAYVMNNPVNRLDPDGRDDGMVGLTIIQDCQLNNCRPNWEEDKKIVKAGIFAASLFLPGPEDLVMGAFVAKAGFRGLLRLFRRGDDAADIPKASRYENITKGNSVENRATDVTRTDFGRNLEKEGFTKTVSKDGKVTIYQKDGVKYTIRDTSSSTGGPTAEVYRDGELIKKIRLEHYKIQ